MSKHTTEDKIQKIWDRASIYSSEASKVARQLSFGEGAIFWFFFHKEGALTNILATGLLFLVLYFLFDISQYIIGAWINKNLAITYDAMNNNKPIEPEEIIRPQSMNYPMYFCYYIKFIMLATASLLLFTLFLKFFVLK